MVVASVQRVTPAPLRTAVRRNASRAISTVSSRTTRVPSSTGLWSRSSASRSGVTGPALRALASRRGRWPSQRSGGALGERPGARAQVARALLLREHEVLGALHADEVWREVEQQGRVELAAVHRPVGVLEVAREVEGEYVDREDAGLAGAQGRERLLVGVVAVGGQDDEAFDPRLLPRSEQVVHPAVQRLAADRGVAGEGPLGDGVDPIFDRRGAQDLERPGEVVGQALDDDGVATERQVGAVLLARSHRDQEAGIALENETHLVGDEGLQVQRRAHVALAGCATTIAAAEWLHGSAPGWAWAAGAASIAVMLLAIRTSHRPPALRLAGLAALALACLTLGATLVRGVLQVQRIECCWPKVRERRLPRDSSELKGALAAAVAEARRLAERGMTAALLPREAAFERVRDAMHSGSGTPGVERGVVILAPDGEPVAWAGRHRFVPARDTAELRAVITPFYVSLEARRQTLDGGSAVGTVLLDAVPAAPDRDRAVSAQFEAAYGVALRFYTPGLAPREPDVFDYCPISCERGDTLFSVQPVPPSQGDAKLAALRGATQRGGGALAVARRARGGLVRGARAAGLVVAHGGAVLARRLLPPRAGRVQRVGRLAHRGWGGGPVRRERAVAARARAALVDRRRRGRAGARGAVPRPLPRPRHRAAGGRRGVRVVDVVGDGGRDRRDGTHPRRRRAGAWHERAATRALDPPGGVRVGGRRRVGGAVAVESLRGLARVVHLRVAPRLGRCARAGAAPMGRPRHRDGGRDRGRTRHLGRGGGRSPRPRRAGRSGTGPRTRPPRRVAAGALGNRAARAAASHRWRTVRLVARLAACN